MAAYSDVGDSADVLLRRDLAQGNRVSTSVTPVLRHLLAHDDHALFGDDVLARLRGMLADVARQLACGLADDPASVAYKPAAIAPDEAKRAAILAILPHVSKLLAHVHALALEWQVTEKLQLRIDMDPVLSPLLQALIASPDAEIAAGAMKLLAAQSRFVQAQRRMQLPLAELPGELLHSVFEALRGDHFTIEAEAAIRAQFDEAASRQGLLTRLVSGMGAGAIAALDLPHAGVAIFTTALAQAYSQSALGQSALGQPAGALREFASLCLQEGQALRLVLSLHAAGVKRQVIEEDLIALHPGVSVPPAAYRLSAERAAALLNEIAT